MIVERIWTGNAYRNFNYLIACPETGEALAIDPLDHEKCLSKAKANGWRITQILNTHEHHDHTGGNAAVVAATGAKLIAHARAAGRIDGVDRGVVAGDIIKVGKRVELECLDTPGHTMCHICLRSHTEQAALFSGDTLFNAGAGNCHNGGDPNELYATFAKHLATLPDDTLVYPGHDYIESNLKFTLSREPDNRAARERLPVVAGHDPAGSAVTTLAEEKTFNTFFFPVGDDIREIVVAWVTYLREEKLWGNDDPLFPATHVALGTACKFEAAGLTRGHWRTTSPIRAIFRDAFVSAGLPYFNPHSFRHTLVQLGESVCRSPEQFKAWSQNLGHENVLTTFLNYGEVACHRQGEIIRGLATPQSTTPSGADEIAEAVYKKFRDSGVDMRTK